MAYENRDYTHLSAEEKQKIESIAQAIRNKAYGIDVRESIALAIEWVNREYKLTIQNNKLTLKEFENAKSKVSNLELDMDEFIKRYSEQVAGNTSLDETIDARVDAAGDSHTTLKDRIDKEQQRVTTRFEENPNPSIGKGPKGTRPVITFVTDDARRQDITIFKDMFKQVGLPVSTAVAPYRTINTGDYGNVYLTVDEIRTLQDEFGWEIVSHAWNHENLTNLTDEELDESLKKSRDWLRDNGFNGYEFLMYPFGGYDERVKRFTAKYYKAARTTSALWSSVINEFPVSSYQLSTRFISQTVSLDVLKADVDRLIDEGGWLNLFFHSWEIDNWGREDDFKELLNYVKEKQNSGLLDVMGYKDTYEKYGNIIDQSSYVDKNDDMFIVQQNGTVRSNIGKTKKLPNNSVTNDSLPQDFPANFLSFVNITQADKGFPTKNGTLETMYFTPQETELTNRGYARQTFYPYGTNSTYSRTFGTSSWMAWNSSDNSGGGGTSGGLEIITGSSVDGTTAPSNFPQNQITVYSQASGTSGFPTKVGGLLSVYKLTGSYAFWFQEFRQVSSNNIWKRYASSTSSWSDWVKAFPLT